MLSSLNLSAVQIMSKNDICPGINTVHIFVPNGGYCFHICNGRNRSNKLVETFFSSQIQNTVQSIFVVKEKRWITDLSQDNLECRIVVYFHSRQNTAINRVDAYEF